MASQEKLKLRSSDGQEFIVEEKVAILSQSIKYMVEDGCATGIIPLTNVDGKTLAKVIEYCKNHAILGDEEEVKSEEDLKNFDQKFVDELNLDDLHDLLLASNYLEVNELLNLVAQKVASFIKGKTPEEIRKTFNIKNDFTPEEEEQIKAENPWAFQ